MMAGWNESPQNASLLSLLGVQGVSYDSATHGVGNLLRGIFAANLEEGDAKQSL